MDLIRDPLIYLRCGRILRLRAERSRFMQPEAVEKTLIKASVCFEVGLEIALRRNFKPLRPCQLQDRSHGDH